MLKILNESEREIAFEKMLQEMMTHYNVKTPAQLNAKIIKQRGVVSRWEEDSNLVALSKAAFKLNIPVTIPKDPTVYLEKIFHDLKTFLGAKNETEMVKKIGTGTSTKEWRKLLAIELFVKALDRKKIPESIMKYAEEVENFSRKRKMLQMKKNALGIYTERLKKLYGVKTKKELEDILYLPAGHLYYLKKFEDRHEDVMTNLIRKNAPLDLRAYLKLAYKEGEVTLAKTVFLGFMANERQVSMEKACKSLGVSRRTVTRWIAMNKVQTIIDAIELTGRNSDISFYEEDLDEARRANPLLR